MDIKVVINVQSMGKCMRVDAVAWLYTRTICLYSILCIIIGIYTVCVTLSSYNRGSATAILILLIVSVKYCYFQEDKY